MENVKEFLKKATEIQDFASKRAEELLMSSGCKYKVWVEGFEFDETQITVKFQEKTRHDCPDHDSIKLIAEQLEMSNLDWSKYIEGIAKQTLEKEQKRKDDADKAKLEAKQKEFDRLKTELGY